MMIFISHCFFFTDAATTEIYTLSLHDALPIYEDSALDISDEITRLTKKSQQLTKDIYSKLSAWQIAQVARHPQRPYTQDYRSEEHTSELQSQFHLVCRLLLEKKKNT